MAERKINRAEVKGPMREEDLLPPLEPEPLTTERKEQFLKAYAIYGTLSRACKEINLPLCAYHEARVADPVFAQLAKEAKKIFAESLEEEAHRRAVLGHDEDVYYQGQCVGTKKVHSDRLLELMLKANLPEKYRERHELTGSGGGPVEVVHFANIVRGDSNGEIKDVEVKEIQGEGEEEPEA